MLDNNVSQYNGGVAYGPPDQYQQPHPHHQRFPCPPQGGHGGTPPDGHGVPPQGGHGGPPPGGPQQPPQYAQQPQYPNGPQPMRPNGHPNPPQMMHSNINQRHPSGPPHFMQRGPPPHPVGGMPPRPVRTGFRNPVPYRASMRPQQPQVNASHPPQYGNYRHQPQDWQRPQLQQQPPNHSQASIQPQVSQHPQQQQSQVQLANSTSVVENSPPKLVESHQIISSPTTTTSSTLVTTASVASHENEGLPSEVMGSNPLSGSMQASQHSQEFVPTLQASTLEPAKIVQVPWGWMRTTLSDKVIYKR